MQLVDLGVRQPVAHLVREGHRQLGPVGGDGEPVAARRGRGRAELPGVGGQLEDTLAAVRGAGHGLPGSEQGRRGAGGSVDLEDESPRGGLEAAYDGAVRGRWLLVGDDELHTLRARDPPQRTIADRQGSRGRAVPLQLGHPPRSSYAAVLHVELDLPGPGRQRAQGDPDRQHPVVVVLVRLAHPAGHRGVGVHLDRQVHRLTAAQQPGAHLREVPALVDLPQPGEDLEHQVVALATHPPDLGPQGALGLVQPEDARRDVVRSAVQLGQHHPVLRGGRKAATGVATGGDELGQRLAAVLRGQPGRRPVLDRRGQPGRSPLRRRPAQRCGPAGGPTRPRRSARPPAGNGEGHGPAHQPRAHCGDRHRPPGRSASSGRPRPSP